MATVEMASVTCRVPVSLKTELESFADVHETSVSRAMMLALADYFKHDLSDVFAAENAARIQREAEKAATEAKKQLEKAEAEKARNFAKEIAARTKNMTPAELVEFRALMAKFGVAATY